MKGIQDVNRPSSLYKDFVSRCLKSEVQFLQGILKIMEQSDWPEDFYIKEALRMSAGNLKDLGKYLSH